MDFAVAVVGVLAGGVLAGGAGIFKWAIGVEKRLWKVEVKTGVES